MQPCILLAVLVVVRANNQADVYQPGVVHPFLYDLGLDSEQRHIPNMALNLIHAFSPHGKCEAPAKSFYVLVGYGPGDAIVNPNAFAMLPCLNATIFETEHHIFKRWLRLDSQQFQPEALSRIDYSEARGLSSPRGMDGTSAQWKLQMKSSFAKGQAPIKLVPGDQVLARHVFMLSVDVQDAELDVLQGLEGVVASQGIDVILAELTTAGRRNAMVLDWFESHDYVVFDFISTQFCSLFLRPNATNIQKQRVARRRYCAVARAKHSNFRPSHGDSNLPSTWSADEGRPPHPAGFSRWLSWFTTHVAPGQTDVLAVKRSFLKHAHLGRLKATVCHACKACLQRGQCFQRGSKLMSSRFWWPADRQCPAQCEL